MRKIGSVSDFSEDRNRELLKVFYALLEKESRQGIEDVFMRAIKAPASRFWVSERRAAAVVGRMNSKGDTALARMLPARREMYREIYRRYLLEREERPKESMVGLVSEIVNSPAPEFYLTFKSARVILYRFMAAMRERRRG